MVISIRVKKKGVPDEKKKNGYSTNTGRQRKKKNISSYFRFNCFSLKRKILENTDEYTSDREREKKYINYVIDQDRLAIKSGFIF